MSPGGVFAHLPEAVRARLPALDDPAWQGEARADCARCPMAAAGGPHPWAFSPETRCCTAHPSLANFLVGRALGRAGPGPALIRARLADPDGVTAFGIEPSAARERRYRDTIDVAFGRDVTLRCPYWVGGDHSCGVWHDRGATCRAWFCKHDHGLVGAVAWSRASFLVSELEGRIARWCVGAGGAPAAPADAAAWIAWYQACAARVDALDDAAAATLLDGLAPRRDELIELRRGAGPRRRLDVEVLVPSVSERVDRDGDVLLTGYSTFDAVRAPHAVFELLARLDGRPWRAALAEARAALAAAGDPAPWLDEALVAELRRVGALRDPAGGDDPPFEVELVGMDRWARAALDG